MAVGDGSWTCPFMGRIPKGGSCYLPSGRDGSPVQGIRADASDGDVWNPDWPLWVLKKDPLIGRAGIAAGADKAADPLDPLHSSSRRAYPHGAQCWAPLGHVLRSSSATIPGGLCHRQGITVDRAESHPYQARAASQGLPLAFVFSRLQDQSSQALAPLF